MKITAASFGPYVQELLGSLRVPPIDRLQSERPGVMRGVDYYGQYLPRVMMISVKKYYEYKERVPDHPLECDTFLDKLFWSKFFTPMPIPTPADKLMIGEFIPRELENRVRPAKVYWSSAEPDIPRSIQGQAWRFATRGILGVASSAFQSCSR